MILDITDYNTTQALLQQYVSSVDTIGISISVGVLSAFVKDATYHRKQATISETGRYGILIIWDGSTIKLYVNELEEITAGSGGLESNDAGLFLGAQSVSTVIQNSFNGKIETIIVFGRAITIDEINTLKLFREQTNG